MSGTLYILTGPSGAGKSSIAHELLKRRDALSKVVTCTTRPPRPTETDGVDYHFLNREQFEAHIEADDMFEWAEVYGNYYGSRKADVDALLEGGQDVLMVIDVQGARAIKAERPEAVAIFLEAESPEVLIARLERRDKGQTINLEERRAALEWELAFAEKCEHVVFNRENQMEAAVEEILGIME